LFRNGECDVQTPDVTLRSAVSAFLVLSPRPAL
jgi:hypothetical protein